MSIWRLPCEGPVVDALDAGRLVAAIWIRRTVIRNHRDQRGDDRCWLDDWAVWGLLEDTPPMPRFTAGEGMKRCEEFFLHRNARDIDTAGSGMVVDPDRWDVDILEAPWSVFVLRRTLSDIQRTIRAHRDISGRPRTCDDDRALYAVLPEGIPADFRLPPQDRFLGEAGAPGAGCPSFWRSHGGCAAGSCNLHRWGPCGAPGAC